MKASQLRARYWRIVFFFGRVTLGFIFWEIFLPRLGLGGWSRRTRSERNRRTAVRFRALAIRMGGLMIKVGQFLSARLDVLPPEITDELAGLQDEVPAESFEAIRAQAEAELGLTAVRALRVVRRDPAGRGVARAGAPRAAARGRRRPSRASPTSSSRSSAPTSSRSSRSTWPPCAAWAAGCSATSPSSNRADVPRSGRGVRRDHPRGDRLPRRGQQRRDLRRQLRRRPARARAARRLDAHDAPRADARRRRRDQARRLRRDHRRRHRPRPRSRRCCSTRTCSRSSRTASSTPTRTPGNLFVTPLEGTDEDGDRDWQLTFIDFGMVGRVPENLRAGLREAVIASRHAGRRAAGPELQDARRAAAQRRPQADRDGEHAGVRSLRRHEHERPARDRPRRDDELRPAVPRADAQPALPAAREPAAAGPLGRDPVGDVHRARPGVQPVDLDRAVRVQARVRRGHVDVPDRPRRGDEDLPGRRSACRAAPTAC